MFCLLLYLQLINEAYQGNRLVLDLLFAYDWYFMPNVNPDGYVYSMEYVSCYRRKFF